MAKMIESMIVIKVSELVKDDDELSTEAFSADTLAALEEVVQELVGAGKLVEIIKE
jgi:hypothetical protein